MIARLLAYGLLIPTSVRANSISEGGEREMDREMKRERENDTSAPNARRISRDESKLRPPSRYNTLVENIAREYRRERGISARKV